MKFKFTITRNVLEGKASQLVKESTEFFLRRSGFKTRMMVHWSYQKMELQSLTTCTTFRHNAGTGQTDGRTERQTVGNDIRSRFAVVFCSSEPYM